MNGFSIYSSVSPWFIFLCLLTGAGYTYLLYNKRNTLWSKRVNLFLAALRFILAAVLMYLLFGPVIRYFQNSKEKPVILFQLDNSASIRFSGDSLQRQEWLQHIHSISDALNTEGIETELYSFNGKQDWDQIRFDAGVSNLHDLIQKPKEQTAGKNIVASVLISDGIYNAGMDPSITLSTIPVYTLGIGDTTTKRDVRLRSAIYNKISYKGNDFPIVVEASQKGFNNMPVTIQLRHKGKILESRKIVLSKTELQPLQEFRVIAEQTGIQHYSIEIIPLAGEFTVENNIQHIYVEVLDNKQKILIASPSAHPDIKAIQAALSGKDNIEINVFIPGITTYKEDTYSLVILHHYPDGNPSYKKEFDKIIGMDVPKWYIVSNQTSIPLFNQVNGLLQIQLRGNQKDLVFGQLNESFDRFNMPVTIQDILQGAPPLQCHFGEYKLIKEGSVILNQRIGRVSTQKPLLAVSAARDVMVMAGEGMWQWRLYEQSVSQHTASFDEFIQKCIQYLSNDKDKRKFRAYPTLTDIQKGEPLYFEAELYNDIMERIYGKEISLLIQSEDNKKYSYSFSTSPGNNRFEVKGLAEGVYSFTASVTINGKTEKSNGEFIIRKSSLEAMNTRADFNLLKSVSAKSNGRFYHVAQYNALLKILLDKNYKTVIHSKETLSEIINLPWIFFFLLALASIEWIVRKLQGGY